MKIKVFIQRQGKKIDVKLDGNTAKELLEKLDINYTAVIITRDKQIITEDTLLKDNDSIEILSVISGG
mgnify:FL=1